MRKVKITIETILFFYLTVFASFFNALDDWNQDSVLLDLIRLSIYMLPMVVLVGMVQYAFLYSVLLVVKWFRMKKRGASAENDSKEQMLSGNKATGYFRIFSMGILFL